MSEFAGAVAIMSALDAVAQRELVDLKLQLLLRALSEVHGPTAGLFRIEPGGAPDAGLAVGVNGKRADGRQIFWQVEVWMYPGEVGTWSANVKAEIDLDDREGSDRCVLNEQVITTTVADAVTAIRDAGRLVSRFPLEELLTDGWEPAEWDRPPEGQ